MTPSLMREFKNRLKGEKMYKRLTWAVATFALSVDKDEFFPDQTMVWGESSWRK